MGSFLASPQLSYPFKIQENFQPLFFKLSFSSFFFFLPVWTSKSCIFICLMVFSESLHDFYALFAFFFFFFVSTTKAKITYFQVGWFFILHNWVCTVKTLYQILVSVIVVFSSKFLFDSFHGFHFSIILLDLLSTVL